MRSHERASTPRGEVHTPSRVALADTANTASTRNTKASHSSGVAGNRTVSPPQMLRSNAAATGMVSAGAKPPDRYTLDGCAARFMEPSHFSRRWLHDYQFKRDLSTSERQVNPETVRSSYGFTDRGGEEREDLGPRKPGYLRRSS